MRDHAGGDRGPFRSLSISSPLPQQGWIESSVYSGKLGLPYDAFAAGLGDFRIVTTLCPGGKERMRRLMELVRHGRVDLTPPLTHRFPLDRIGEAYALFGERRDGVLKVALTP